MMYHTRYIKNVVVLILILFLFLTVITVSYKKLVSIPEPGNSVENEKSLVKEKSQSVDKWEYVAKHKDLEIEKLMEQIKQMKNDVEYYKSRAKDNALKRQDHKQKNYESKRLKDLKRHEPFRGKFTKEEVQGGEPKDPINKVRRDKVRQLMKHAWDNYIKYAWGQNELRPISKTGHSASIFGNTRMGISIIDSLDTLYIMGMNDEFNKALDWIKENLDFDLSTSVSVFEITIRFLGGLLTAFTLTKDVVLLQKATSLGDHLLDAFDTNGEIPYSLIDFNSKFKNNYNWADGGCSILAEIGTLHMEFAFLSEITGNPVYVNKVNRIREILYKTRKQNGLYMNFIHPKSHSWCSDFASLAGLGDSFYEYLIKEYVRSNKRDKLALKMYNSAMDSMKEVGMFPVSSKGHRYVADYKHGSISDKMDHLGCFSAGMMALGAPYSKNSELWLEYAKNITNTCHDSYKYTETKLGPESFHFDQSIEAVAVSSNEKVYILRPETFESYFYLWRVTKDPKYRDWAYEAVLAIETHCKVAGGISGIHDVYSVPVSHDDVQQSFLMAETLKYLYLIFSEDTLIPLDRWVFNTEGHPFPIKDVTQF